jgi:hypothetical protein
MISNGLKLAESVAETAKECPEDDFDTVIVPCSSATIAAGVARGMGRRCRLVLHLGYSRSAKQVLQYVSSMSGCARANTLIVNEKYTYKDKAKPGLTPPWPCNPYYDLKALRWWMSLGADLGHYGKTLFWNIG